MAWKADNIQVVLFTKPGSAQPDALQVWNNSCKNSSPDGFNRGNNTPMGISVAFGVINIHNVRIQSQLGRVDILCTAVQGDSESFPHPQIHDISKALKIIKEISMSAVALLKPIRIGLVVSMAEFVDNMDNAAQVITSQVEGLSFPSNSSDHIYQYNVPKMEKEKVKSLNRIVTYGTGILQEFGGSIGLSGGSMSVIREIAAATLKIDINTLPVQDVSNVSGEVVLNAFSEMDNIVENGVKELA